MENCAIETLANEHKSSIRIQSTAYPPVSLSEIEWAAELRVGRLAMELRDYGYAKLQLPKYEVEKEPNLFDRILRFMSK